MDSSQAAGVFSLVGVLIFVIGIIFWLVILYLVIKAAVFHANKQTLVSAEFRNAMAGAMRSGTGTAKAQTEWPAIR